MTATRTIPAQVDRVSRAGFPVLDVSSNRPLAGDEQFPLSDRLGIQEALGAVGTRLGTGG
jgi:hypothetical protein